MLSSAGNLEDRGWFFVVAVVVVLVVAPFECANHELLAVKAVVGDHHHAVTFRHFKKELVKQA